MRTAIVGSSGYIAGYILDRFNKEKEIDSILKIDKSDEADCYLDLENPELFDYTVLDNVDYLVFTAAISGPDKCAEEYEFCWNINVNGTIHFIKEAIKKNCRVLFFSSDAVFGDIPGMIYDETSETNAVTPYGKMKKAVEDEFRNEELFKAIRLSYVASSKDRFVSYCYKCIQSNDMADIFHPFYRNVIVISDVVDVVLFFAKAWEKYEPRFFNVAGIELVSRVRMADEINRIFGGRLKYVVSMPGEKFFENRPMITQMKSIYNKQYNIVLENTFSEKFKREMEDVEI